MISEVCLWEETNMRSRVGVLFTTTFLIILVLVACGTLKDSE